MLFIFCFLFIGCKKASDENIFSPQKIELKQLRQFRYTEERFISFAYDAQKNKIVEKSGKEKFQIHFVINEDNKTGKIIGNVGTDSVAVVNTDEKRYFIEETPNGTLQILCVFNIWNPEKGFYAVYNRNVLIAFHATYSTMSQGWVYPLD